MRIFYGSTYPSFLTSVTSGEVLWTMLNCFFLFVLVLHSPRLFFFEYELLYFDVIVPVGYPVFFAEKLGDRDAQRKIKRNREVSLQRALKKLMTKDEDFKLLKIQTCTCFLKMNTHCDGSKPKVKKLLQRIEGVYQVNIDADQQKFT